jgi:tetratricopeptide (TPR) repeat protein
MLQELLERNPEVGALTYQLFQTTLEREARKDALLADVMPLCALPPSFDADVIGVLRGARDAFDQNRTLFQKLTQYNFVQMFEDGTCAYHETLREPLREEVFAAEPEKVRTIYRRLAAFYLERGQSIYEAVRKDDRQGFDRAMIEFNRGLAIAPDSRWKAEYHHWRGRVYMRLAQYNHALRNFSQAIEYEPDNWRNYYRRATVRIERLEYDEAIADLEQVMALRDDVLKSFFARGIVYSKLQDYDRALADFDHALTLPPDKPHVHADIYQARGIVHWHQQRYDQAIADLTQAIEVAPEDGDNYFWRGIIYHAARHPEQAIADFSAAIQRQEQLAINYRWRGTVYQEQQQYAAAEDDFTQAIALDPDNDASYYWRARTRCHRCRYDAARDDFDAAIARNSHNALYYSWRGTLFFGQGDDAAAQSDFDRAVALGSHDYQAYEKRASALYASQPDRLTEALADLDTAITLQPDTRQNSQSYFWRALVLLDLGRQTEAFSDIERVLQSRPTWMQAVFWRGVMHHVRGAEDAAEADWAQAARLADQDDLRLALPLLMQGDTPGARACYTRAFQQICRVDRFRYQLADVQRLQRLYPQRTDIAEIVSWFQTQRTVH